MMIPRGPQFDELVWHFLQENSDERSQQVFVVAQAAQRRMRLENLDFSEGPR